MPKESAPPGGEEELQGTEILFYRVVIEHYLARSDAEHINTERGRSLKLRESWVEQQPARQGGLTKPKPKAPRN